MPCFVFKVQLFLTRLSGGDIGHNALGMFFIDRQSIVTVKSLQSFYHK